MLPFARSCLFLGPLAQATSKAPINLMRRVTCDRFLSNRIRNFTDITMPGQNPCLEDPSDQTSRVYVQHSKGKDMMTISFEYASNGKKKSFNLYRKADEPLSFALERLKLNITKLNKVKKQKTGVIQEANSDQLPSLSLTVNGSVVDPTKTKNVEAWIEGAVMQIDDRPFIIKRNEPQVLIMKLPSTIMKGFITLPFLDLANCGINTCKFHWFRQISAQEKDTIIANDPSSESKIECLQASYWLYLASGITYSPCDEDVAHHLKVICQPSDGTKVGPKYSCLSSRLVELGPPSCPFEKRQTHTREKFSTGDRLRLVSYNILADLYADSEYSRNVLFAHCPAHALEIDYRRQLILKEIHGYNADIICLQEVDRREFIKTYEPYFKLVSGHNGVFNTKGGQVAEGEATFFRQDRFELIDSHKTVLSRLIDPHAKIERDSGLDEDVALDKSRGDHENGPDDLPRSDSMPHPVLDDLGSDAAECLLSRFESIRDKIKGNEALSRRFMGRHTIVQTNLLKFKDLKNKYVIVANTHLYFAPDADHIRLLQGSVCTKYLEYMKEHYRSMIENQQGQKDCDVNIILCGDMNSSPDSGLFKLLHEGKVDDKLPDWKSCKGEFVEGLSIDTGLRFSSAYQNIPYTNYTPGFNGCLDYIYHELDGILCESTVPLPDHEDVIEMDGIPSDVFPSDHIALIANLRIKT